MAGPHSLVIRQGEWLRLLCRWCIDAVLKTFSAAIAHHLVDAQALALDRPRYDQLLNRRMNSAAVPTRFKKQVDQLQFNQRLEMLHPDALKAESIKPNWMACRTLSFTAMICWR